ncbi:uncharacterized protein SPPG_08601 [Spizellomyces punctatus DAOM BR117]|uniref:Uncharacterized protein n=1 Tax=Spizellomyces punctatus (strain DAOM BR117) TaxID=645134 RepID=A0A0L0H474_SPIPD|nr:uncharacterized protein SPPG_08601 [Spizellomyces punctatus DAOM BR117]KNC96002.1 hypothetical protein SPPG_08601 [Spizellomyces punctatus DAOM BR117]|eukprot:XP_016604042.1 hypothetical protein SPPG_08601 [Spizellomyces punctatus DAOM BR117]
MGVTDKAALFLIGVDGKIIPEYVERSVTRQSVHSITTYVGSQPLGKRFKIVAKNIGCRPTFRNLFNVVNSDTKEKVVRNLCFLIYVDEELVYARIISRIGEGREIEGYRKGNGQIDPFEFGTGKGARIVNEGDSKERSGSIRMEVWNAEVLKKLTGYVPIWPGEENEQQHSEESDRIVIGHAADITAQEGSADPETTLNLSPNAVSAVICRRVGAAPIVTHTIIYGKVEDNVVLDPLREVPSPELMKLTLGDV